MNLEIRRVCNPDKSCSWLETQGKVAKSGEGYNWLKIKEKVATGLTRFIKKSHWMQT
jgi:hypothetical protein